MYALITRRMPIVLVLGCQHGTGDTSHDETGHDETAHMHESTGSTGSTGTGGASETGHDPPTGTEPESGTSGGSPTPAVAYCECMVVNCHDDYHGTWGEDHEMSEAMCEAEAAALPSVGMPATQGESIECRTYYCELAKTDGAACASAIGGGSCT